MQHLCILRGSFVKKLIVAVLASGLVVSAQAATSMFGEADARVLLINDAGSSYMHVSGYASEFGFKGTQAVSANEEAFFRIAYQADITGANNWPVLSDGEIGLKGDYGTASIRYGYTPLGQLNNAYHLIDNSPIWSNDLLATNLAGGSSVPVGTNSVDALNYVSPVISNVLTLDAALIPAEKANGQTGLSVAAIYKQNNLRFAGAFEANVGIESTSIVLLNGDIKTGNLTVGGTVQRASNSALETSATHLAAYAKLPLNLANLKSDIQLTAAFNTVTNAADESSNEFNVNYVQNIPLNNKVSLYSLFGVYLRDNLETTLMMGGGGLKVRF